MINTWRLYKLESNDYGENTKQRKRIIALQSTEALVRYCLDFHGRTHLNGSDEVLMLAREEIQRRFQSQ